MRNVYDLGGFAPRALARLGSSQVRQFCITELNDFNPDQKVT